MNMNRKIFTFPPVKFHVKFTMQMGWNDLQFIINTAITVWKAEQSF